MMNGHDDDYGTAAGKATDNVRSRRRIVAAAGAGRPSSPPQPQPQHSPYKKQGQNKLHNSQQRSPRQRHKKSS
eukprot:CAMPEP_0172313096 /NCGR_PEP_ID=MMETSP1058-20130122/19412_1 /TAXON_ID=83371 /ORGANISM="Detonula confervacea, Strain CCMP 353" /LENGTH=72 /DNA_ID=CAMNT_0013026697 /DNA_START=18 /DNA_END=232 /DNA_ORIENTATION=+